MANALMNFEYEGQAVRTVVIEGEPWWALNDVCGVLGMGNPRNVSARLDEDEKGVHEMDTPGGSHNLTIVNEAGLYNVILRSNKPEAKAFKRWIVHEVLPQIRKTGSYGLPKRIDAAFMQAVTDRMLELESAVEERDVLIAEMTPKATYYDYILNSPNLVKTKVIAADYGMTARQFNKLLEEMGVQYREGKVWHLYSKYLGRNYAKYKTMLHDPTDPSRGSSEWMYWTQKGRMWLYEKLKADGLLPLIEREAS